MADLASTHSLTHSSRSPLDLTQSLAAVDWFASFHRTFWAYEVEDGRDCDILADLMKQNGNAQAWVGRGVWKVGTYK